MLDENKNIVVFVMVYCTGPPDLLRMRIDEAEGGLTAEYDEFPILFCPGSVFFRRRPACFLSSSNCFALGILKPMRKKCLGIYQLWSLIAD
jgi:hypothetical protein